MSARVQVGKGQKNTMGQVCRKKPTAPACSKPRIFDLFVQVAGDNETIFQAIALPGAEATLDCRDDDEEEGIALRRARRECRRKQMEDGEVFSQDGDDDYYGGNIEDDHHLGGQTLDSESQNSLDSDLFDYEYHDNCSTYYDGRYIRCIEHP